MQNVYLADAAGNIHKYSPEGRYELTFSPTRPGVVHLLEAWSSIKILAFYKVFQRFLLLDRFLTLVPAYDVDPSLIGFARQATLSADDNLWVLDDTDFTLKKYNPQFRQVIASTPLGLVLNPREYDIRFMREYQNQLFLSDYNSGILVFDNMGTYRKKIAVDSVDHFGFIGDELYYVQDSMLHFFHLYNFDTRTQLLEGSPHQAVVSERYIIEAYPDRVVWRGR
jgi:hypothetical protein